MRPFVKFFHRVATMAARNRVLIALCLAGLLAVLLVLRPWQALGFGHGAGHDPEHAHAAEPASSAAARAGHAHAPGEAPEAHGAEPTPGPHGGQWLYSGAVALEVLLAPVGEQTRLRVWRAAEGPAGAPQATDLPPPQATVTWLTGEVLRLSLAPDQGGWLSREALPEPHAFEIRLTQPGAEGPAEWVFRSSEGLLRLSETQIQAAALGLDVATPSTLTPASQWTGEIRLNEDLTAHVVPRVTGVVEHVPAQLGQRVRQGQVLAVIASATASELRSEWQTAQKRLALARLTHEREQRLWQQKVSAQQDYLQAEQALQEAEITLAHVQQKLSALGLSSSTSGALNRFELRAPRDGVVIEKHLSQGESIKEDAPVFTVSDLSQVWAEVHVPARDLTRLRVGDTVQVQASALDTSTEGRVTFVGALIGEQTRLAKARVLLANPQGAWRPGLYVTVSARAPAAAAPTAPAVTVASDAVQTLEGRPVVFVRVQGGFIAQPVTLGRSEGARVEVLQGLKAGASYVARGSFVLKSELGKASAEHSH